MREEQRKGSSSLLSLFMCWSYVGSLRSCPKCRAPTASIDTAPSELDLSWKGLRHVSPVHKIWLNPTDFICVWVSWNSVRQLRKMDKACNCQDMEWMSEPLVRHRDTYILPWGPSPYLFSEDLFCFASFSDDCSVFGKTLGTSRTCCNVWTIEQAQNYALNR